MTKPVSWRGYSVLVGGAIVLLLAGFALGMALKGTGRTVRANQRQPVTSAQLKRSLALANRFVSAAGYPFALGLVGSLNTANPRVNYQALDFPAEIPQAGAIGVYTSKHSVWLRARSNGAAVIEARSVSAGPGAGNYGPYVLSDLSAADGDFTTPLTDIWTVQSGPIASAMRDTRVYLSAPASLRIIGTGRRGSAATTVTQQVGDGAVMPKGTRFHVALAARSRDLSRPLYVELKLDYVGGSFEFFEAQGRAASSVGIPAGSSNGWVPLELTAIAARPVNGATLFAADTGVIPLRGTAWVDNIVATEGS